MRALAIYWVIGCLLVGAAQGHHMTKCPKDPEPTAAENFFASLIWIGVIGFAFTAPSPPYLCKSP